MRPWTPQYPVRTQVVSRTLFEPSGILFEPQPKTVQKIIDFKKKKIQKFKHAGIGNIILRECFKIKINALKLFFSVKFCLARFSNFFKWANRGDKEV